MILTGNGEDRVARPHPQQHRNLDDDPRPIATRDTIHDR
jgi:hypothetical protein